MVSYWYLVRSILIRYAEKKVCAITSLESALYLAATHLYRGKNYKNVIRLGKRVIDNHCVWENE